MSVAKSEVYNALIRTHHITSRKKVAALRKAADTHDCYVLLRSGGCPGVMYCEGRELGVQRWVDVVQNLRYKDFKLTMRPSTVSNDFVLPRSADQPSHWGRLEETSSVAEFAAAMSSRNVLQWWRRAMGYVKDD